MPTVGPVEVAAPSRMVSKSAAKAQLRIASNKRCTFRLGDKLFNLSVLIDAEVDGEAELRVWLREWIVELVVNCRRAVKNVHALGPSGCCRNIRAKYERVHCVSLSHSLRVPFALVKSDESSALVYFAT